MDGGKERKKGIEGGKIKKGGEIDRKGFDVMRIKKKRRNR